MIDWVNRRALGTKVALALGAVFTLLAIFNVFWLTGKQEQQSLNEAHAIATGIAETVLSSLNSMMVSGSIDDRGIFLKLIKDTTHGLNEIRVFRSSSVTEQHGEGEEGEQPKDELERKVLKTGKSEFVIVERSGLQKSLYLSCYANVEKSRLTHGSCCGIIDMTELKGL